MVETQGILDRYMYGCYLLHFTVDINGQQADGQSFLTIYAISNVKVAFFSIAGNFFACEVISDANPMIQVSHTIIQERQYPRK
jgi:hypothetical protein